MHNIVMTSMTIEAACAKLREQLQNTHVTHDKVDISVPTKFTVPDAEKPTIMVSVIADRKMRALVQQSDKEIGWHGTVSYDEESNTYLIEDIFVFPQEVTGTTVQSIDEQYGLWLMETFDDEQFAKLRMHGHSHVNMGTSPSGIDTAYQETLTDRVQDFYIFIILNKRDDYYVCLFDIANNLMYDKEDLYYDAEIEEVDAWAKDAIATQVKTKTYANATTPVNTDKYPVVLKSWRQGWVWTQEASGYTPSTELALHDYLLEQDALRGTQSDRRKPGRPKKNHGGDTKPSSDAYKKYQQEKLKEIDERKAKEQQEKADKNSDYGPMYAASRVLCDGNCIACQRPCDYNEGFNGYY